MISIIITAFKEPKTILKAIKSILANDIKEKKEIIVVAPDNETLNAAKKYKEVRLVKDKGEGKPSALNLAVKKARGSIIVLTDGDVYISNNALPHLLEPFNQAKIGAVTGNPVSTNQPDNKYGYWAYVLTNIANQRRLKALEWGRRFFCSGYLFAIRKKLFPKLKREVLSEDGFISHNVYEKGYKIEYSPNSEVYVKYPDNFKDWILQKKRSAGGYNQIKSMIGVEIRSFKKESSGALDFFRYVSNIKEFVWTINLFLARLYLWFVIYRDIDLKQKSHKEIWKRVESTK